MPAGNIHLHSLVGAEAGVAGLESVAGNAAPGPAPPISNSGDLPTTDHVVENARGIAGEFLAPAKGQINHAVETDVMGRNFGGVEIDEVKPLVVTEIRLAKQVNDFRWRSSRPDIVYAGIAACETSRVGGGQGVDIGIEPLKSHAFRKSAFYLDLA